MSGLPEHAATQSAEPPLPCIGNARPAYRKPPADECPSGNVVRCQGYQRIHFCVQPAGQLIHAHRCGCGHTWETG